MLVTGCLTQPRPTKTNLPLAKQSRLAVSVEISSLLPQNYGLPILLGTDPEKAIDHSLHELNTDYIDLYLIHMPFGDSFNAWRAMETAVKAGKMRAIGVSNFSPDQVTNLMLFNELKPAVNQIEVNPWNQQPALVDFNYKNNIQTEAWAPFAEGKQNIFTNPALTTIADNHRKNSWAGDPPVVNSARNCCYSEERSHPKNC